MPKTDSLWEEALASLSEENRIFIDLHEVDKRAFLGDVTRVVEESSQLCSQKQWRMTRNGKSVSFREWFGKIISWIDKFREVGDVVVQYDPTHAALPWAAVRLVLQAVVNEHKMNEALLQGLEYISSLIARFAMVEGLYLHKGSIASEQLSQAIIRLYSAVLVYLAKAGEFYSRGTSVRFLKAVTRTVELNVDVYLQKIQSEEAKVNNLARLLDADHSRQSAAYMEQKFSDQNTILDALNSGIQDLSLMYKSSISSRFVSMQQVLDWIDAVFTQQDYEQALAARIEGSCNWILQRPELVNWNESSDKGSLRGLLWIYGPAGFGKSILCARLIQYLRDDIQKTVVFFFCSFADNIRRQPLSILRSWIAQLVMQKDTACEVAKSAYLGKQSKIATEHDLWHLFKIFNIHLDDPVYVVDGFDECTADNLDYKNHAISNSRARFLESLLQYTQESYCHVLLVSRGDQDIMEQLSTFEESITSHAAFRIGVTQQDNRDDVNAFSSYVMEQRLPKKSDPIKKDLAITAANKCEGMFLWVRLLQLSPGKNARQLQKIVSETPAGLNQAYERDLRSIQELAMDEKHRAIAILRWIMYATRPLSVRELTEALLIQLDDEHTSYPRDDLPDTYDDVYVNDQIRRLCGSLIDVKPQNGLTHISSHLVQLVHFSVKEYLTRSLTEQLLWDGEVALSEPLGNHAYLTQCCLQYLCYDNFNQRTISTVKEYDERSREFAFLRYASTQWGVHNSRRQSSSPNLIALSNRLHDPTNFRWRAYSEVLLNEVDNNFTQCLIKWKDNWPGPVYLACLTNIVQTVEYVLDRGADVNAVGGTDATALQRAACGGDIESFKLLLSRGADPSFRGGFHGSVVNAAAAPTSFLSDHLRLPSTASAERSESMLRMLIPKGVDLESSDRSGQKPLHCASASGALNVVQLLVESGIVINSITSKKRTALHVACEHGHAHIVTYLLSKGADASMQFEDDVDERLDRGTALHIAANRENEQIVRILLDYGVDCTVVTSKGISALQWAAWKSNFPIVELLVSHGATLDDVDSQGTTLLQYAAMKGNHRIAELLLRHGADVDTPGFEGLTAFLQAVRDGNLHVAKLLLKNGADMYTSDRSGRTCFHIAAQDGDAEMIKMLFDQGFELSSPSDYAFEPTASHSMVKHGHLEVAKILSDHGLGSDVLKSFGETLLYTSCATGSPGLARLFSEISCDLNTSNHLGLTPLMCCATPDPDAVSLLPALLGAGADINQADHKGWTTLHHVVKNILRSLRAQKASGASIDESSLAPGSLPKPAVSMIEILLSHGGDPLPRDKMGLSSLDLASGYPALLALLTDPNSEYHPPDEVETMKIRHQAINPAIQHYAFLMNLEPSPCDCQLNTWFSLLGRLLFTSNRVEDARTVLLQLAPRDDSGKPSHNAFCDICSDQISDERYLCEVCFDIDLCAACMEHYPTNSVSDPCTMALLGRCRGHSFFRIDEDSWQEIPRGKVNEQGESVKEFVQRLLDEFV